MNLPAQTPRPTRWLRPRLAPGLLSALLAATPTVALAQARPVALRHDVFSRPSLQARPLGSATPSATPTATATATATAASEAPAPAWRPQLRALVVAGARSMVLIDASVVELGGSLDGYRLQAVDENGALFVKGRQRVTLLMGQNKDGE
jgi:hypothetical protein